MLLLLLLPKCILIQYCRPLVHFGGAGEESFVVLDSTRSQFPVAVTGQDKTAVNSITGNEDATLHELLIRDQQRKGETE